MIITTKLSKIFVYVFVPFLVIYFWVINFSILAKAPYQKSDQNILGLSNIDLLKSFKSLTQNQYQNPVYLIIDSLKISANVEIVSVEPNGSMQVPANYNNVGWLKTSSKLGQSGNLVLSGHYDTPSGAPAVFFNLQKIKQGDIITVVTQTDSGLLYDKKYKVTSSYLADPNNKTHVKEAFKNTTHPTITLITCNGIWNSVTKEYSHRVVVKGELVN